MPKRVKPANFEGQSASLLGIFGVAPKFTITCGECRTTFKKRVPVVDEPGIPCPHCGAVNVMPLEPV